MPIPTQQRSHPIIEGPHHNGAMKTALKGLGCVGVLVAVVAFAARSLQPTAPPGKSPPCSDDSPAQIGRIIMWSLSALILAVGLVLVLRRHMSAKKAAPAPATDHGDDRNGKEGRHRVYLDAIGTVTPVHSDSITSQVNGLVVAVHYEEGQQVAKGDPLIDIDPRPYRAVLLQAQGTLERDENLLAQAQMDLERYRAAWARDAIAKQTLDDQEKTRASGRWP